MANLKVEDILELNDKEIERAVFQPETSRRTKNVFKFLRENDNLVTTTGGMDSLTTGLDRSKLFPLALSYGIEIDRYTYAVNLYETGILEQQKKVLDSRK